MSGVNDDLIAHIRDELSASGDAERAAQQQAYMKSAMPFHGIAMPEVRKIVRSLSRGWSPTRQNWEATVRALYDEADHREERIAALALARHRCAKDWLDPEALPLIRHLITTGAWWDMVDEAAVQLLGPVVDRHEVGAQMRVWARDDDPWIRRAAVLCQLKREGDTDQQLLSDVIEANLGDTSFWLRKAIGWALRQYARTDPDWVSAKVEQWPLAPLARREALKHIG